MPFSDTSNKTGLIQRCEFWTGLGDTGISGVTTLLKQFTTGLNVAFDEVLPIIYSADSHWQWDDSNHTDQPTATTNLVSGQSHYSIVTDEQGNSVLEIHAVYIQDPNGAWTKLDPTDSPGGYEADPILSQNSTNTGTPTRYDKRGVSIILDSIPDYSVTGGMKVVFARSQSYFVYTDTTKKPGIPRPFHEMLALITSRNWVAVHLPEAATLLTTIKEAITEAKAGLKTHISKRARDEKTVMRTRSENSH